MKNILKRMAEIRTRKAELRQTLENDTNADLDKITEELRDLDTEYADLEKRQETINGINIGAIPTNAIDNPLTPNNRSENADAENKEYRSAWLKNIRGLELNETEQRAITTASGSAASVIPTSTRNKIVENVSQFCPILDKIDLLRVPGGVTIPAEGTTNDAKIHAEGATITSDNDTLVDVVLSAYEITKLVTISKSVEKMSIDAFEAWLVKKIARKIADKINALIFNGSGKNEAEGVNAITWDSTNSVTVTKADSLTAANVQALVALLNGGYDDGAEWYMSKTTFFNDFHPLMNNAKDNIVTENNGKYRVMGYPVQLEDRITLHEALLGNFERGYAGNMPEDITVTSQFVVRENAYDFFGCAMFDGKVQAKEAFVKLIKATA